MEQEILMLSRERQETSRILSDDFPFWHRIRQLSHYYQSQIPLHWHPDLELILVTEGSMYYQADLETFLLEPGQGILVNSNILHGASANQSQGCRYLAFRVSGELFCGASLAARQKYLQPLLYHPSLPFLLLQPEVPWHQELIQLLHQASQCYLTKPECWTMELQLLLQQFWIILYRNVQRSLRSCEKRSLPCRITLYRALEYIQRSYSSPISLESLAAACQCSRASCCRIFARVLHQSPMEYLRDYRLHQSLPLLASTSLTVTEIAFRCGFNSSSYYTETFHRQLGCTPLQYRKENRSSKPSPPREAETGAPPS